MFGVRGDPVARSGARRVRVIIEADGGSRGNPGPAGFGCVVWSADHGTVLAEHKQFIGLTTNNVAEYRGLIAGLEEARRLGANEVAVSMDSKLIVEQMNGRWKVKHPGMAELHQQARALASTFDAVTYSWIPRERNKHADRLANEAMDSADGEIAPSAADPPPGAVAVPPSAWTGNRGGPTRLLLLRHGQTELSVQRRYSGRGNPELTDIGRGQAEDAARYLAQKRGIAAVVSSPLARAHAAVEAADLMRRRASELFEAGEPCGAEGNMAKLLASEASWQAANACIDAHGGFGFAEEYDVERKFRETRLYLTAPISNNLVLAFLGQHVLKMPRSY